MPTRYIYGPRGGPKVEFEGPLTDEEREARDEVLDRIRGGPRTRLKAFANECEMSYDDFMQRIKEYVEDEDGESEIPLGTDSPDIGSLWDDYELVTGKVVPESKRNSPFTCAC